jgi:ankyrin repeat protein
MLAVAPAMALAEQLTESEVATLSTPYSGEPRPTAADQAAQALAPQLGRRHVYEALPILAERRDPIAMSRYLNEYGRLDTSDAARAAAEALALRLARDPRYDTGYAAWSTREGVLSHLLDYDSRDLWQLLYDGTRRRLEESREEPRARGPGPYTYLWADTASLVPRRVPGIEAADAELVPLMSNTCQGMALAKFFAERHYAPAFAALHDLYRRSPLQTAWCDDPFARAFAGLASAEGNAVLLERLTFLAALPDGRERNQQILTLLQVVQGEPAELVLDMTPRLRAALPPQMSPQLRAGVERELAAQDLLAHRQRDATSDTLAYWIDQGDAARVAAISARGVGPRQPLPSHRLPLERAIETGNAAVVRALLDAGAAADEPGLREPLLTLAACAPTAAHASSDDARAIIEALLAHGAPVDQRDAEGQTALHRAAACAGPEVLVTLLKGGAAPSARAEVPGSVNPHRGVWEDTTPLHYAARAGRDANVVLLLDHGVPIDARAGDGGTALLWAVTAKRVATVRLLLDRGANARLGAGDNTPVFIAFVERDADGRAMEAMLEAHGARLDPLTVAKAYTEAAIFWMAIVLNNGKGFE